MAKREMIVSGYTGDDSEEQVEPFLRHLLGQFSDSLSEADKILLEYTSRAGLPDLYFAVWDDEALTLTALGESPDSITAMVGFGWRPATPAQWKRLRDALSVTLCAATTVD